MIVCWHAPKKNTKFPYLNRRKFSNVSVRPPYASTLLCFFLYLLFVLRLLTNCRFVYSVFHSLCGYRFKNAWKCEWFSVVYQTSATCAQLNFQLSFQFRFTSLILHLILFISCFFFSSFLWLFKPPITRTIKNETSKNRRHDLSFSFLLLLLLPQTFSNYSVFDLNHTDPLHDYRINFLRNCKEEEEDVPKLFGGHNDWFTLSFCLEKKNKIRQRVKCKCRSLAKIISTPIHHLLE